MDGLGARYCPRCGTELHDGPDRPGPGPYLVICSNCGTEVSSSAQRQSNEPDPPDDTDASRKAGQAREQDPEAPALGVVQPDHELPEVPEPNEPS